jgi:N-carbamoyl-L-amino-acid hydrolase
VVEGVQGIRWYEVTVTGQDAHAGPTPMPRRKDALVGVSQMVLAVNRIGMANQPYACATVGMMQVSPNSRNVIPGKVFFTVDFRHPDADTLKRMGDELKGECEKICRERKLELDFKEIWYSPPVKFNDDCVKAVQKATEDLGFSNRRIVSGAGHDSVYMSRVTPTSILP